MDRLFDGMGIDPRNHTKFRRSVFCDVEIDPRNTRNLHEPKSRDLLFGRGTVEEQLVVADAAIVAVERGKGIGSFFQHLLGHGD